MGSKSFMSIKGAENDEVKGSQSTNQSINQSINQLTQCQSINSSFQRAFNNFNKLSTISIFKFLVVAKFMANFQ